jgi:hypothetical protein
LNKEKVKNMASKLSVTIAADTLEEAQALAYKFALAADDVGSAAVLGSQPEPEPKASKPEPKASEPEPEPEPEPQAKGARQEGCRDAPQEQGGQGR